MRDNPDSETLLAFHQRRLPPAAMLRVDHQLGASADARAKLAGLRRGRGSPLADAGRDRAAVHAVVARGAHLSFEQLRSFVDARLSPAEREQVEAHASLCGRCARELRDLGTHAAALREAIKPQPQRTASAGSWLSRWLGDGMRWAPGLAIAGIVGALVLTIAMRPGGSGTDDAGVLRTTPGSGAVAPTLQHQSLDDLSPVSIDAALAWQSRDLARLLTVLRPLAAQRQPQAMSALASLYALGLGVPQDLRMAEQLWQRAADLGHAEARANLEVLRRQAAGKP